jgi:solute carrier family 6 (neurotransmitter transporter, glycine) member 5/9
LCRYEATAQVFFSLGAYFGTVIIYASYNKFDQKSHIDAQIVTTLDTFTSILAGSCVFAILGHLKHELGADDIKDVIKSGSGMVRIEILMSLIFLHFFNCILSQAFISYPEAIARFENFSSLFAVLFFLMLYVLGIGSLIASVSGIMTTIQDNFKCVKNWQAAMCVAIYGVISGSIYYTQSGQEILELVDSYGVTFVTFNLAICEIVTFCYIYGVERIMSDIKFMLGFTPGVYWRTCWKYLTPTFLIALLVYDYISKMISESKSEYPFEAQIVGYLLAGLALIHLPLVMIIECFKSEGASWSEKIKKAFSPLPDWGPLGNKKLLAKYQEKDYMTRL